MCSVRVIGVGVRVIGEGGRCGMRIRVVGSLGMRLKGKAKSN